MARDRSSSWLSICVNLSGMRSALPRLAWVLLLPLADQHLERHAQRPAGPEQRRPVLLLARQLRRLRAADGDRRLADLALVVALVAVDVEYLPVGQLRDLRHRQPAVGQPGEQRLELRRRGRWRLAAHAGTGGFAAGSCGGFASPDCAAFRSASFARTTSARSRGMLATIASCTSACTSGPRSSMSLRASASVVWSMIATMPALPSGVDSVLQNTGPR